MTTRFSVLLPTRNGAAFLENCVRSILDQDFPAFELIVSDNANQDGTQDVLQNFSDRRLTVLRQASVLSVDENWNAAYRSARGDYVLMMGDDDYLLPGALRRLDEVAKRHREPDCILFNGYSYVAPNSLPGDSHGYWSRRHHNYDEAFSGEGELDKTLRLQIVRDMYRFRQRIPLNMQTTLFSRVAADRVGSPPFRQPFPDHYLLNALLIAADRWIYLPEQPVIIGVSPKSFGHYVYGHDASRGLQYLGIKTDFANMLPGNELLNGMCAWLTQLKQDFPTELSGVRIDRSAYVIRQLRFWILQHRHGAITGGQLAGRLRLLGISDAAALVAAVFRAENWRRIGSLMSRSNDSNVRSLWRGLEPFDQARNISEFAAWLAQLPKRP